MLEIKKIINVTIIEINKIENKVYNNVLII